MPNLQSSLAKVFLPYFDTEGPHSKIINETIIIYKREFTPAMLNRYINMHKANKTVWTKVLLKKRFKRIQKPLVDKAMIPILKYGIKSKSNINSVIDDVLAFLVAWEHQVGDEINMTLNATDTAMKLYRCMKNK